MLGTWYREVPPGTSLPGGRERACSPGASMIPAVAVALALAIGGPAVAGPKYTPADRRMEAKDLLARPKLPIPLPVDPLGLNGTNADGTPIQSKVVADFLARITALLKSDMSEAEALASDPVNPDPNGAACWKAMEPISALVQKHPLIFSGETITDIQAARSAMIQLNLICQSLPCRTVFTDAITVSKRLATLAPVPTRAIVPDVFGDFCAALTPISTSLTTSVPAAAAPGGTPAPAPTPKSTP